MKCTVKSRVLFLLNLHHILFPSFLFRWLRLSHVNIVCWLLYREKQRRNCEMRKWKRIRMERILLSKVHNLKDNLSIVIPNVMSNHMKVLNKLASPLILLISYRMPVLLNFSSVHATTTSWLEIRSSLWSWGCNTI